MGDIRNKLAKIERKRREKVAFNRFMGRPDDWEASAPPPQPLPRCACGRTWLDVPKMWSVMGARWRDPAMLCCPGCLPFEYWELLAEDRPNYPP